MNIKICHNTIQNENLQNLIIIFTGIFLAYFPTFYHLFNTLWQDENHIYEVFPIIISSYIFFSIAKEESLLTKKIYLEWNLWAWLIFISGLMLHILGHSQDIPQIDILGLLFIVIGITFLLFGKVGLQKLWFPIMFLSFSIPIPGSIIDATTGTLKIGVSQCVEYLLHQFEYPISRDGVILTIGNYQLLVADACSGLNSIIALITLTVLYLYLTSRNIAKIIIIVLLILPIAFIANIARVLLLSLITYHYGDSAGQGFAHNLAGFLLFFIALTLLIISDKALTIYFKNASPNGYKT